jgi:hypothetical protein
MRFCRGDRWIYSSGSQLNKLLQTMIRFRGTFAVAFFCTGTTLHVRSTPADASSGRYY